MGQHPFLANRARERHPGRLPVVGVHDGESLAGNDRSDA